MNYIALTFWDLAFASGLIFLHGAISLMFRLGIGKQLIINALRMCVQLSMIGFVLRFIFAQDSIWWTAGLGLIMVLVAGREIFARQSRAFTGQWTYGLATLSMMFAATLVLLYALNVLVKPEPWYAPRYALPLFGMLLGNTMTGISLGLETLITTVARSRAGIEARLALGATRWQAMAEPLQVALRSGMMPIVNAMAASGIVSLPGMMTGQILAGVEPVEAVKYQILIMFLIGGTTALGVLLAVSGASWRLTDDRDRLRLDRLRKAG
jgi:putative ABC transport system permease protein